MKEVRANTELTKEQRDKKLAKLTAKLDKIKREKQKLSLD